MTLFYEVFNTIWATPHELHPLTWYLYYDHLGSLLSWSYGGNVILSNINKYEYWLTFIGLQDHTSIYRNLPLVYFISKLSLVIMKTSNTRLRVHLAPSTYVFTYIFIHKLCTHRIPTIIVYLCPPIHPHPPTHISNCNIWSSNFGSFIRLLINNYD